MLAVLYASSALPMPARVLVMTLGCFKSHPPNSRMGFASAATLLAVSMNSLRRVGPSFAKAFICVVMPAIYCVNLCTPSRIVGFRISYVLIPSPSAALLAKVISPSRLFNLVFAMPAAAPWPLKASDAPSIALVSLS